MKEGWKCPRCHIVNSPYVEKCDCTGKNEECKEFYHVYDIFEDFSISSFAECLICGKKR